ncbi:MAG: GAP family protein [bacterium]
MLFGTSIIPLALTVMFGPQILVAMLLITHKKPIRSSLIYILSVEITIIFSTTISYLIISAIGLHLHAHFGNKDILKYIIVVILVLLIVKNFLQRKKITAKPKWMSGITEASLKKIFLIGLVLVSIMPTDLAMALTVGGLLVTNEGTLLNAVPFFAAVLAVASVPLLFYLVIGERGHKYIDRVNKWLNTHGWVINMFVYCLFIFLVLF